MTWLNSNVNNISICHLSKCIYVNDAGQNNIIVCGSWLLCIVHCWKSDTWTQVSFTIVDRFPLSLITAPVSNECMSASVYKHWLGNILTTQGVLNPHNTSLCDHVTRWPDLVYQCTDMEWKENTYWPAFVYLQGVPERMSSYWNQIFFRDSCYANLRQSYQKSPKDWQRKMRVL